MENSIRQSSLPILPVKEDGHRAPVKVCDKIGGHRPPLQGLFRGRRVLVALAFACFAFAIPLKAVTPPPDGGYPNENTAEGEDALFSLTSGVADTAIGFQTLYRTTIGIENTGVGYIALSANTTGNSNTAVGSEALASHRTGDANTAVGAEAMVSNTRGFGNTGVGACVLFNNDIGSSNTVTGFEALYFGRGNNNTVNGYLAMGNSNTSSRASNNTAIGGFALADSTADYNTATGVQSLLQDTTGHNNTANGARALENDTTGSNNVAVGSDAGINLTTGNNNIDISNEGVAGEAGTIRIGTRGRQTSAFLAGIYGETIANGMEVRIDINGHLGTRTSSARFKEAIKPMKDASEALFQLEPVTFRYKPELDPTRTPQFGLIAEQVAKVNPDLVVSGEDGKANTVRYDAVNAMLLNEFLKEHRKVEELENRIAQQARDFESVTAKQRVEIANVIASLKEQASEIRRVKNEMALNETGDRVVTNER